MARGKYLRLDVRSGFEAESGGMGLISTITVAIGKLAVTLWLRAKWRQLMSRPIFYPNRTVLDRESPLADKINNSSVIDAVWLTGTKPVVEITNIRRVRRLLLPNPASKSLAYFQSAMTDVRDLGGEIRETTRIAKSKGINVRWLNEFLGYTLTIGDPEGKNEWFEIGFVFITVHGGNYPSIELRRSQHGETIDQVIKMFDDLWASDKFSREPEESEFNDGTRQISQPRRSEEEQSIETFCEGTPVRRE